MKHHVSLVLLSVLFCFNLWSCKSKKVQPQKPDSVSRTHTIQEELSTFYVPIEVSLNHIERTINELFKDVIYKDDSFTNNGNDDLKVTVKKLKNIQIDAEGNVLKMTLPLSIWANARQSILGMEMTQDATIHAVLQFNTMLDIDENWNLKTKTSNFKYEFVKEPVIKIGGINMPMTGILSQILDTKIAEFLPTLDQYIMKSVDIRKQVDAIWKSTQMPLELDPNYSAWAKIKPTRFIFAPIKTQNRVVKTAIGIESYIEIVSGEVAKTPIHNKPLPKLSKVTVPSNNFHIALSSEMSFTQLTQILKKEFNGFTYEDEKRKITVTDINSYGNGDNMVFKINFTGSVEGELFASGRPAYDSTTKELYIEELEFDVNTKKALVKVANWLLNGTFKKQIQKKMRFSMKEQMATVSKLVEESLLENTLGSGLKIDCQILDIHPKDISVTDYSIKTLLIIDGKALVKYGK